MKKIFTLIAASFITIATFAADRKPVVSVSASKNYEVIIDGHSYFSDRGTINVQGIRKGQHSIKVYEVNRNPFRKIKKLVSATTFQLKNSDIDIYINSYGKIDVNEDRFGRDHRFDDRDDHGRNDSHDRNDRDYGKGRDKNEKGNRF